MKIKEIIAKEMPDILVERGIATEEEIQLVEFINGISETTYLDILFARTGYHSIEQMEDEHDYL